MNEVKINPDVRTVLISVADQRLWCLHKEQIEHQFEVSTALLGCGQEQGSLQTPLGLHQVRAKIGTNAPIGAVFVGRRPTGEVWSRDLHQQFPGRDWILSRILWLSGSELGFNRLGGVDTMRRFIYIHGTPDTEPMGEAQSHGCVRMRNDSVITLFDWVAPGTPVVISSSSENELQQQTQISLTAVAESVSQADAQ